MILEKSFPQGNGIRAVVHTFLTATVAAVLTAGRGGRGQYQGRAVRWLQFPRRQDFRLRAPYQRNLSVAMRLNQYLGPEDGPGGHQPGGLGQVCLASYVRHVARTQARTRPDGTPVP